MTASIKQLGARAKHGMANSCELPLNVVIENKLKMLRSLTKRYVGGTGVLSSPDADNTPTGGEAEPNPCMVYMRNVRAFPNPKKRFNKEQTALHLAESSKLTLGETRSLVK